jgi:hypothetical protein
MHRLIIVFVSLDCDTLNTVFARSPPRRLRLVCGLPHGLRIGHCGRRRVVSYIVTYVYGSDAREACIGLARPVVVTNI